MSSFPFAPHGGGAPPPKKRFCAASSREAERQSLRALKEGLARLPHERKSRLAHVQAVRPDLADDGHMMGFLRAEGGQVEHALNRLLRYWDLRHRVFGPDRYALPMTLNGAMKDSVDAVKNGFLSLLPTLDGAGRAILYNNDRGYRKGAPSADEKLKVWWYLLHVAMENPRVAEKGFVVLTNSRDIRLVDFDPKFLVGAVSAAERAFSIEWKTTHVCNASSAFPRVANAIKAVLPLSARSSFMMHDGSDESVLKALSQYSLTSDCLPTELGGALIVDEEEFVKNRLAIEGDLESTQDCGKAISIAGESEVTSSSGGVSGPGFKSGHSSLSGWSSAGDVILAPPQAGQVSTLVQSIARFNDEPVPNSCASAPDTGTKVPWLPAGDATTPVASQKQHGERKRPPAKKGRGRTGDPRMERAVQARMDNPDLNLVQALVAGGYSFPDLDNWQGKVGDCLDAEGVKLYQRRNQLLRRIRLAKKKDG